MPEPQESPFTIDAFAGKSPDELREDCRRLLCIAGKRERLFMQMIEFVGADRVNELPEPARTEANRLIEAYKD